MPRSYIINALDIGSGSIKLLSIIKKPGEESLEIIAQEQEVSLGVRKGVVINIKNTAETISSLIERASRNSGRRIESVYANIGGGHIHSACSKGLVSVSRADRKISEEDVDRVLQAARAVSLSSNNEIIQTFPREFIVDGEGGVKEVVGMEGVRLEAEALLLCGFSPYIKNSSQSIESSGLQINDLVADPLASAKAVLTPREKELGVCVLDIGAGTTGMAVFEEGNLIHAAILPVGSGHITNDIAICLKTDIDTAEKIKLEFATCKGSSRKTGKKIKLEAEEPLSFSTKLLMDIVDARVCEIFNLVDKELRKACRQEMLPAGVVLTGGGAKLPGIKDLAKKELRLPCRIGIPKGLPGFQAEPSLSTLMGLVLEGIELEEESNVRSYRWGIGEKTKKLGKSIAKIFVP